MFDAKRLLGQFIADQVGRKLGGSGGGPSGGLGSAFGGGGRSQGGLGGLVGAVTSNPALAGGLASLVLGSKKGRKLGGSAARMGGLALVGTLAYQAYQSWQAGQAGGTAAPSSGPAGSASFLGGAGATPWAGGAQPAPSGAAGWAPPPPGSPFAPTDAQAEQDLSRKLLRAMIAAAKSDGHIDATEQTAIFGQMDKFELDADDKAFVMDELRTPLDVEAVARSASGPEEAAEIYAASLLAIDVDNPAERGYLGLLAARLRLDDGLVAQIHASVARAAGGTSQGA